MRDRDLGVHPSKLAPAEYKVRKVGERYFPMRRCSDGEYRGWNRYDAHGIPIGAQTFATAQAAIRYCRRHRQRAGEP